MFSDLYLEGIWIINEFHYLKPSSSELHCLNNFWITTIVGWIWDLKISILSSGVLLFFFLFVFFPRLSLWKLGANDSLKGIDTSEVIAPRLHADLAELLSSGVLRFQLPQDVITVRTAFLEVLPEYYCSCEFCSNGDKFILLGYASLSAMKFSCWQEKWISPSTEQK